MCLSGFVDRKLFLKSFVYRVFASFITSSIAFLVTGNVNMSLGIGCLEFIGKIFSYYIFELFYNRISKFVGSAGYRSNCYKFNKTGKCIWISGLNCSGKTTIAKELMKHIPNPVLLDGDAIRKSINYDLGFTQHDIRTNLQKVANLTSLLIDQGYNVIVSCISKSRQDREFVRQIIDPKNFIEVHVDCDEDILRDRQNILHRDTKIIQKDYEPTTDYDVITVDSGKNDPIKCVKEILCSISRG